MWYNTHWAKTGLSFSGERDLRRGDLTVGMKGERERDRDLRLWCGGESDLDLERERSVEGDLQWREHQN